VLPFDLPPPIPITAPAPEYAVWNSVEIAKEIKPTIPVEEQAFNKAVSNFQQHLAKLPPAHKAEIRKIHTQVTDWADKQRAAGQRADKLSTFVGKVMAYTDKHLENIEKADPDLRQFKAEHKQFQDLFLAGNGVIEAYLAWVRTDYKNAKKPKNMPKKV
jgi:hypothetical protein